MLFLRRQSTAEGRLLELPVQAVPQREGVHARMVHEDAVLSGMICMMP